MLDCGAYFVFFSLLFIEMHQLPFYVFDVYFRTETTATTTTESHHQSTTARDVIRASLIRDLTTCSTLNDVSDLTYQSFDDDIGYDLEALTIDERVRFDVEGQLDDSDRDRQEHDLPKM